MNHTTDRIKHQISFLLFLLLPFICIAENPIPITRESKAPSCLKEMPQLCSPKKYPWEEETLHDLPKITQEHFRCRGSELNPVRLVHKEGKLVEHYLDCGGIGAHSLPLREGEEFIYPILIDLLNYVQDQTSHAVIITSGHRCPQHHLYVDTEKAQCTSKHMVGAEVAFYVDGLEDKPEQILDHILDYYKESDPSFLRYHGKTDITTPPWYNKEIFVKLYKSDEGRNGDNRHPYPYLSIQVRFDTEKQQKVQYNWNSASKNYLRY